MLLADIRFTHSKDSVLYLVHNVSEPLLCLTDNWYHYRLTLAGLFGRAEMNRQTGRLGKRNGAHLWRNNAGMLMIYEGIAADRQLPCLFFK
jgi:hypothetical protein